MTKLYYTPPADEIFDEVRAKAMILWEIIDTDNDKYGYATDKKNRIKDIGNVGDNFMYIVAMFDIHNQRLLANELSEEARNEIRERMIDGGNLLEYIVF